MREALSFLRSSAGRPHREWVDGFTLRGDGRAETGSVQGRFTLESPPDFDEVPETKVSPDLWSLIAKVGLVGVLALMCPLFYPLAFDRNADAWSGAFILIGLGCTGGAAYHCNAVIGRIRRFRFTSIIVYLQADGSYSRSRIRVGKARDDSIESDNLVLRSDFSLTEYIAIAHTEGVGLFGNRRIIGLEVGEAAGRVEAALDRWVDDFTTEGATVMGVNLRSGKVREIVQANLSVSDHRTDTDIESTTAEHHVVPKQSASAPAIMPESTGPSDAPSPEALEDSWKTCPECAEVIRWAAVKCRFCGYRYAE